MRLIPHTCGGRHDGPLRSFPGYSERTFVPEILLLGDVSSPDIGCAYDVSMPFKSTPADVFSAVWLLSVSTGRARLRRVGFTDAPGGHSAKLRLVLDHSGKPAVAPLVELLVRLRAVVDPLSDSCHVAHYNGIDPSFVEGLNQPRGLLVQEILDLIADLREGPVLRSDNPQSASATSLW